MKERTVKEKWEEKTTCWAEPSSQGRTRGEPSNNQARTRTEPSNTQTADIVSDGPVKPPESTVEDSSVCRASAKAEASSTDPITIDSSEFTNEELESLMTSLDHSGECYMLCKG